MKSGRFIVFEGLDGSGQTTQVDLLAVRLKGDGHKVLVTKEPTNNLVGGLIRGALTGEWRPSNQIIQLLYAADRGHHLEREILPALAKGFIVISDRYFFSSIAFGSLNCDTDWLKALNRNYPQPDHAFYVRVSPQTALKRIRAGRFEFELFEKEQQLTLVAAAYEELIRDNANFYAVDGEQPIEAVHEAIYRLCCDRLIRYCPLPTVQASSA